MQLKDFVIYIASIPRLVLEKYGRELIVFLIALIISGSIATLIIYKTLYWKTSQLTFAPAAIVTESPTTIPTQISPQITKSISADLPEDSSQESVLININSATLDELDALPGIGPVYAQRIIDFRPFITTQSITRVPGIGQKTFNKIEALITVE